MKSIIFAAFIVGLVLLSGSAVGASVCVAPDLPDALDRAGAVFVGKLVEVAAARTDSASLALGSDYLVKFQVEELWKGSVSRETRILWRPEMFGCSNFPVGEIGQRYLVYADSKSDLVQKDTLEITIFNRTSLMPPKQIVTPADSANGTRKGKAFFYIEPELNRKDASNDIQVLRRIEHCGCLRPYCFSTCIQSTRIMLQPKPGEEERTSSSTSPCCTCLLRGVMPVASGFLMQP